MTARQHKTKNQVKLFLKPENHDLLRRESDHTGRSMSVLVEELIEEVLRPEVEEREPELPLEESS